jgi:predicted RNA methylase
VDTVIMNPPFGTRRKGADMEFLSAGLKVTCDHSLIKSTVCLVPENALLHIMN